MDFQYSNPYSRPPPPPPSISDQHHYPPPPPQPPGTMYSGQFQFHPSSSPPPPPPPPPHPHQWAPPPQLDHLPPRPPPYALHNHHQYPPPPLPPRPHFPPPNPHIPQSYPQDWGNPNLGHHQGWEYPAHNHEEDWAAKARAWASTKDTTDNQPPQQHFMPVNRPEEQNLYPAQYRQNVDPHYSESNYTQHQHLHGYLPYRTSDGVSAGDANPSFPHQESSSTNLSVHQQEVPSSYSSVAGKEEAANQNDRFYNSLPFSTVSTPQHQAQPPPLHYSFGNQSARPATEHNDQPLVFAHGYNHEHGSDVQPNYTHSWTPSAVSGAAYHPVPPLNSSGSQDPPPMAVNSPVSGYSAPIFGRMPGPSFQQPIPSVTPAFGTSTGNAFHPTSAFLGEAYGASGVPERPKKAPVPNWLREEIIKKKTVMTSSAPELSHDESRSIDEDDIDNSERKGDQADSKNINYSRSTEEEDDDEDDMEAARNAAINQEIKRVLTEVLLKVTDELFDEIATKVISEDDLTAEVHHNGTASNNVAPFTPAVQTPMSTAKILIPATKKADADDVREKSTSSTPGDVLGLGDYASDGDDDDAIQSSVMARSKVDNVSQHPTTKKSLEDISVVENGNSRAKTDDHSKTPVEVASNPRKVRPNGHVDLGSKYSSETKTLAKEAENNLDGERVLDGLDDSRSKISLGEKVVPRTELAVDKRPMTDDFKSKETRNKIDTHDKNEIKSSAKVVENVKDRSQDERHVRKEKTDDRHGSREKTKERGSKSGEKAHDSDSRKRLTHSDDKEDRKKSERDRKGSVKEDHDRKKERTKDEKGERSRHKHTGDSSRHRKRRSSSDGHASDSSDGSSDDSKRNLRSKGRNLSPSPVRSRRRQVSRSPHSKHSQRRHSPYSSLDTTRKRSRSRSPARRKR